MGSKIRTVKERTSKMRRFLDDDTDSPMSTGAKAQFGIFLVVFLLVVVAAWIGTPR